MAKPNYQFEKRQRDLAKKSKQEEKRRQKLAAKATGAAADDSANAGLDSEPPQESARETSVSDDAKYKDATPDAS